MSASPKSWKGPESNQQRPRDAPRALLGSWRRAVGSFQPLLSPPPGGVQAGGLPVGGGTSFCPGADAEALISLAPRTAGLWARIHWEDRGQVEPAQSAL